MTVQTTYSTKASVGLPGMLYDPIDRAIIDTVRNDTASSGEISFGRAVARAATAPTLSSISPVAGKKPVLTGDIILGVAVRAQMFDPKDLPLGGDIPAGAMFAVVRQGRVEVVVEDAVTAGSDNVFVRHGGTGELGAFRGTDDSGDASKLTNARWFTSASAGGVAVLELLGPIGAMT